MHGEVQQPGTVASGYDGYESGLQDCPANYERCCLLVRYSRGARLGLAVASRESE